MSLFGGRYRKTFLWVLWCPEIVLVEFGAQVNFQNIVMVHELCSKATRGLSLFSGSNIKNTPVGGTVPQPNWTDILSFFLSSLNALGACSDLKMHGYIFP